MRISYNWLQSFFKEKLPEPEKLADGLIFHSFEVEDVVRENKDNIFEIKILPDRAHDCLCHLGIAREISAIFSLEKPIITTKEKEDAGVKSDFKIDNTREPELCRRYIGRVVRNIELRESKKEIIEKLESAGQKSINNIVDSANFIMFEMGQPLHAFDLDKLKGKITVRKAGEGEKITTLDDKEISLSGDILVIADDEGPVAIAGIKGGKRAGVTKETRNILLESANFNPVNIRRSATKLNLHTDASKRFENDYSRTSAMSAIRLFSGILEQIASGKDTIFEDVIDIYPQEEKERKIIVTADEISKILGIDISAKEISDILGKLNIKTEKDGDKIIAIPPHERLDLNIKEDIAEEVGRINGYEKIQGVVPSAVEEKEVNKKYIVSNKIREILKGLGFSEVYGYAFDMEGDVEILNPLANDKGFLRTNLSDGIAEKIEFNLLNNLFDNDSVKIFEIGSVFNKEKESQKVCIGIGYKTEKLRNKNNKEIEQILEAITVVFKENINKIETKNSYIAEIDLNDFVEKSNIESFDLNKLVNKEASYKKISHYPRVIRDIALFVPKEVSSEEVEKILILKSGPFLIGEPILFDTFEKEKKSLAFRLIFQSYERTLFDSEINDVMTELIKELEKNTDWEVRK